MSLRKGIGIEQYQRKIVPHRETGKEDFTQDSLHRGERLNKRQGGRAVKCWSEPVEK